MAQEKEKVFAKGFFAEEKTFDWGSFTSISVKVDDAIDFLKEYKNDKGYAYLELKKTRDGKSYLELNTYSLNKSSNSGDNGDLPF